MFEAYIEKHIDGDEDEYRDEAPGHISTYFEAHFESGLYLPNKRVRVPGYGHVTPRDERAYLADLEKFKRPPKRSEQKPGPRLSYVREKLSDRRKEEKVKSRNSALAHMPIARLMPHVNMLYPKKIADADAKAMAAFDDDDDDDAAAADDGSEAGAGAGAASDDISNMSFCRRCPG